MAHTAAGRRVLGLDNAAAPGRLRTSSEHDMSETDYHHICTTEPECLCSGEDCDCTPCDRTALSTTCYLCDAPMQAIDIDTGEPLPPGALSSYVSQETAGA